MHPDRTNSTSYRHQRLCKKMMTTVCTTSATWWQGHEEWQSMMTIRTNNNNIATMLRKCNIGIMHAQRERKSSRSLCILYSVCDAIAVETATVYVTYWHTTYMVCDTCMFHNGFQPLHFKSHLAAGIFLDRPGCRVGRLWHSGVSGRLWVKMNIREKQVDLAKSRV